MPTRQDIELAIMDLMIGLPSRCECDTPKEQIDPYRAITACGNCGGLIVTDAELENNTRPAD